VALREPAWRVFASELLSALQEERGSGERAATYLLSPYGSRMNRVLLAGTLSSPETIGRDPSQPFWRARLVDPTDTIAVTAGAFQPRAMAQIQSFAGPRTALVVGKVHLYRGTDGTGYVSIRAESVRTIPEEEMRATFADALSQTLDRLDLYRRLTADPVPSDEQLQGEGIPLVWIHAGQESLRRYPTIDRGAYRQRLRAVLEVISGARPPLPPAPPTPSSVRVTREEPPAPSPMPADRDRTGESEFLDVLDELSEASSDGYADLKELAQRLVEHGIAPERSEEILDHLQEDGVVEEPIVGKLRRA
jgi:RPA family protein